MALPEKNAFTFQEIAQHFGVDEETVVDWIYRGLMHACIKHFVPIDYNVHWHNPKNFNDNGRTCGFDGYLRVNNGGAKTILNNIRDNIRLSSEGFTWFSAMALEPASAEEFAKWPIKAYSMQLPHPAKVNRAMLRISRFERDRFAQEHGIGQPTMSNPQPAPPVVAAKDTEPVPTPETEQKADSLIQQRVEIIAAELSRGHADLMALPRGSKAELRSQLCSEMPRLFTESTFDKAWTDGTSGENPRFRLVNANRHRPTQK